VDVRKSALVDAAFFFFWFAFLWMFIAIFADIMRRDLSDWAKAGWISLIVVLPFLGTLIYLIATPRMTAEDIGLRCSPRPPGF
jgi:uncharacterized membrane protein YhaH (DUF805 family)